MASAYVVTRDAKDGKRFSVRYRAGGREATIVHAGAFKTMRDARKRRDLVAGELAAGRNPRLLLAAARDTTPERTVTEWGDAMIATRLDVSDSRIAFLELAMRTRITPTFGDRAPATIRPSDVQEWVAGMADGLKPRSVQKYWQALAQILDYAETTPNPARHKTVKLPYADVDEATPPSTAHLLALLGRLTPRTRLPAVLLEQTAARVAELRAWTFGDVDEDGSRIRSRGVKGRRGTRRVIWRDVPPWLLQIVLETVPPDDRTPERRIFPGLKEGSMRDAIKRACWAAKIPHYSPHDLRHRRGSLWHAGGMPARELAQRMGHTKASMSLDVYTHVMPPDEASPEALSALLVVARW